MTKFLVERNEKFLWKLPVSGVMRLKYEDNLYKTIINSKLAKFGVKIKI
jgi:hypothetical protein